MQLKTNSQYYSFSGALGTAKIVSLDLNHGHLKAKSRQRVKPYKYKVSNKYNQVFLHKNPVRLYIYMLEFKMFAGEFMKEDNTEQKHCWG